MSDELKPLIKDALKFVFEAAGEELVINGLCAQDICYQIAETGRIDMDNIHSPDDFVDEFISSLKTRPLCPHTLEAAAKAVIGLQHGEEVGLDNELECENNGYQIAAQTILKLKGEA